MTPGLDPRPLGRTGIAVPSICVGTSPLASMAFLYGYEVPEERAVATVEAAFAGPLTFVDTSNGYGEHGEAEQRIGIAVRRAGGVPDGVVLATKADPAPGSEDFSGDRVRRSFEESLERLGVDRVPLLHLHDPERIAFEDGVAPGGPVEALVRLREEGLVDALGVAGGPVDLMQRYLDTGAFDVVLNHNRYTLLDRSAGPLFERAAAAGIGVLNAAPYGGGMLVKGPDVQSKYAYGERGDVFADAARAMARACDEAGVPLAAAALQFSMRSPSIHSTVVGMSSPERIEATVRLAQVPIPDGLWAELDALAPAGSVLPA
ncbi:aldo/keto reductase [Amnibacterium endophyticum]|uniref:Aldo/keto reductase n=1 Tax=Amnibacterium endophyticum TaxID=2109337 RepID=A0ABW4LFR5_9MICO